MPGAQVAANRSDGLRPGSGSPGPKEGTTMSATPTATQASRRRRQQRESWYGFLCIVPALVLVLGVIAVPIVYLVRTSFTNAHAYLPREEGVGLSNYQTLVEPDSAFWPSLGVSVTYTVLTLALQVVLGVVVALLLHQPFRGQRFVRVVAILPYMIPAVVVAIVWRWLLDPNYGVWDGWLETLTGTATNFLGPGWIFTSLVVVSVWLYTPFVTISVLARLQTIDPSVVEASFVDGAGPLRRFWSIVVPEIAPVVLMLALLRVMFMFTKFDIVYLFAGTGAEVRTLPILTFERIFGEARLGAGSTIATVMFVLLVVFTSVYLAVVRRRGTES